jgi:hypothetical protein
VLDGASFDARSRRNGVFDMHFCGASSPTARVDGAPVVVISDDSEVLEAGRRANLGSRVMQHAAYRAIIDGGPPAIDTLVESL